MSMAHDIRITALEKRLNTVESVLESLASEFQAFASGSVPVKEIDASEPPSSSEGLSPGEVDASLEMTRGTLSGFHVVRRPGRGPARYNVEQAGVAINTEPLTLQDAEAMANSANEAVEPLETA